MKLTFDPNTGTIANEKGKSVAFLSYSAHESDPALGAELAAGPEAIRLLQRTLDENPLDRDLRASIRALLASVQP